MRWRVGVGAVVVVTVVASLPPALLSPSPSPPETCRVAPGADHGLRMRRGSSSSSSRSRSSSRCYCLSHLHTCTRAATGDLRGDTPAALRRVEQRPRPALPPQPLAAQHRAHRARRRRSRTRLGVRRWSNGPGRHSARCNWCSARCRWCRRVRSDPRVYSAGTLSLRILGQR